MGGQPPLQEPHKTQEEQSGAVESKTSKPSTEFSSRTEWQPGEDDRGQRADATRQQESSPRRPRRFLAQPIETSSRTSQARRTPTPDGAGDQGNGPGASSKPGDGNRSRRFLPQPIETTKASNRGSSPETNRSEQTSQIAPVAPRRFTPALIETDRRSVKGASVDLPHQHNAQAIPGDLLNPKPEASSTVPRLKPCRDVPPEPPESKFSYANLVHRQETRRHSFRVPDLPSIPSNSSEDSDESSRSPSLLPSPKSSQKSTGNQKPEKLVRESCDGEFSEYLLSLAARSAQKQLKEQTLAAFPNEQDYEPVDHFAIDEEERESEDEEMMYPQKHHIKSRRQSSADLSWELEYMRQHKEEAEMRVRAMVASRKPDLTSAGHQSVPKKDGASPPMLGDDIVLPQSLSPDGTMCEDATAESGSQAAQDPCTGCGGLWCAANRAEDGRGAGLWMGTCRKDQDDGREREPPALSGIMTPMPRGDGAEVDPFSLSPANLRGLMSPSGSQTNLSSKSLEDEFHDGFITQIYNYLSLGYPCLARYYDYELSKISGITVEDLRRDDLHTDARGYVVAPESDTAVACTRWRALRLYIREWARQQPSMAEDEAGLEAWGMPERRGSWAI